MNCQDKSSEKLSDWKKCPVCEKSLYLHQKKQQGGHPIPKQHFFCTASHRKKFDQQLQKCPGKYGSHNKLCHTAAQYEKAMRDTIYEEEAHTELFIRILEDRWTKEDENLPYFADIKYSVEEHLREERKNNSSTK